MSESKRRNRVFSLVRKDAIPLTLTNLIIFVVMTLVLIQGLGLIFNLTSIKLGPIFVLIAIGMAAAMSIAAFRKVASDHLELSRKDVFAIIIVTAVALVLMFFLRDFVPEIFQTSVTQIQSAIGLP